MMLPALGKNHYCTYDVVSLFMLSILIELPWYIFRYHSGFFNGTRPIQLPRNNPDINVHGANMGPTWVLPVPDGPMLALCVGNLSVIVSDNGLSPGQCQTITWTSAGIENILYFLCIDIIRTHSNRLYLYGWYTSPQNIKWYWHDQRWQTA